LAQCLHLLGDREGARRQFQALAALANDVGLLAEMADPATGELIGNIPKAFSQVGWSIRHGACHRACPPQVAGKAPVRGDVVRDGGAR